MRLRVIAPCPEDWTAMRATADGRHCARCAKDVVDLRDATREHAEAAAASGACVRYRVDRQGAPIFATLKRAATGLAIAASLAACGGTSSDPPDDRPPEGATDDELRRWNEAHGHYHGVDDEGDEIMGEPEYVPPDPPEPPAPPPTAPPDPPATPPPTVTPVG